MTGDKRLRRSGRDQSPLRSGDDQAGFDPERRESKQSGNKNKQTQGKNHLQNGHIQFFATDKNKKTCLLISAAFGFPEVVAILKCRIVTS